MAEKEVGQGWTKNEKALEKGPWFLGERANHPQFGINLESIENVLRL